MMQKTLISGMQDNKVFACVWGVFTFIFVLPKKENGTITIIIGLGFCFHLRLSARLDLMHKQHF